MRPLRTSLWLGLTVVLVAGAYWLCSTSPISQVEAASPEASNKTPPLKLTLRTRTADAAEPTAQTAEIDPRRCAVVLVDTWNYHWCTTAAARCGSFVERFNKALPELRKLGLQVFWCPTDVADQYVGQPQRETAIALKRVALPPSRNIAFAPIECFESNHCMCGPGLKCTYNYGWDGLASGLRPAPEDLMPEGTEELYSACQARGITHLIYFGFHTNVCTTGKPVGIRAMANAGLTCILARDMTDAITGYDPAGGHHPDSNTEQVIATIERQVPTICVADELRKLGRWDSAVVDPVRLTPWGTTRRPYCFEESTLVSLTAPLTDGARIHYTLDGSEPTAASPRYSAPLRITETTQLRALAVDATGKRCGAESIGQYVKLPPKPPLPDVYLSERKPIRATCSGYHAFGSTKQPKMDRAYNGQPIKFRDQVFSKGAGVEAPSQLLYALEHDQRRFVGRIAIDESAQADDMARAVAMYPSVVAEIWIDGERVAASPILRYQAEPWRFDVAIPPGSRQLGLIVTDAGDGNRYDFANWIEAGFVRSTTK